MKKLLFTLFTFVFALNAVAEIRSGSCGSSVNWTYDTKTKVLIISGSGEIADYSVDSAPWFETFEDEDGYDRSYYNKIKTVIIGNGITHIGDNCFNGCKGLTSIQLPSTLTSIGSSAFQNCIELTSVDFSTSFSLKSIGSSAFQKCTKLTSVDLSTSSSLKSIGSSAFQDCTGLTSIKILESVNDYGTTVFGGCTNLTHTCEHIIIDVDDETVGEMYTIKSNVKYIEANAFNDCKELRYLIYEGRPELGGDIATNAVLRKITTTSVPSDMFDSFIESDESYGNNINVTTVKLDTDSRFKSYAFLHDVRIPENITAYTATTDGEVVTLKSITNGLIKAGEGVFLKAKKGYAGSFTFTNGKDAQKVNDNMLVGVTKETTLTSTDNAYVMQTRDGVQKFYYVDAPLTLARFKAYLKLEGNNANMFSIFDFDENTTDIEETEENEDCSANSRTEVYNMAGQKLSAPQKGLNIINGKIVIN